MHEFSVMRKTEADSALIESGELRYIHGKDDYKRSWGKFRFLSTPG